jgi:arabinogalactan endo-1,4-beta-galactosidase
MSVELTLLFDGGGSTSVPASWTNDSFSQLQTDLYNYVKAEILAYRQAGTMPDLVSIGNEVDTGFLGSIGSPTGSSFGNFAALQKQAMQAVSDAAADTSIGPAIPPPLTCIHITPAWDLTQFFTLANQNGIPYDAICQSYYPIFHGPLTDTQAAASNPGGKPVEQDVLVAAANNLGKPIFIIETGEHYESGYQSNDPWYSPPSQTAQRQFLIDLQNVVEGLPNNLGMGLEYWDPAGVNIPSSTGGFLNGDSLPDAIFIWNGLTLFDNADTSGITDVAASNYSQLLPGIDGLGGALDSALSYKIVNRATGRVLTASDGRASADNAENSATGDAVLGANHRWRIISSRDGSFQIASMNHAAGNVEKVLSVIAGGNFVIEPASASTQQEWNIVSAGNGYFQIVNRRTGRALDAGGTFAPQTSSPTHDQRTATPETQLWRIIRGR